VQKKTTLNSATAYGYGTQTENIGLCGEVRYAVPVPSLEKGRGRVVQMWLDALNW